MEGHIGLKELEYSGSSDGEVPVANVPLGVKAKLHVWGHNDMDTDQKLGIYWFVADPDASIVEEYEDWQGPGSTGPGETHEFISSGQFTFDKVGKYIVWIELYMGSEDNPERVALFNGDLATVTTGWVEVDSATLALTVRPEIVGWYLAHAVNILIALRPETAGWALMDVKTITVQAEGVEPPPNGNGEPPPPEEKEFPWVPVALIGGGVALAAATMIPSKKPGT